MFTACLEKYMRSGPMYPADGFEIYCKDNWWANLLYINNFWELDKQVMRFFCTEILEISNQLVFIFSKCLGVGWYLANDMQFHWISPILLIPFVLG